jgi:hypothetical protein
MLFGAWESGSHREWLNKSADATPGEQHTIALLAADGPLAAPGGTVFVRYADLAFEWTGV